MSKPRVIVLSVINGSLTPSQAAKRHGVTRQWVHQLLARYRQGGIDAVEPRSKRPKGNARAIDEATKQRIRRLRVELEASGLDHGPVTIAWHLQREGRHAPSLSSIRRVLKAASLITPQPQKRPRSSYLRFEAAQPNECWQSDFTHWQLADGSTVEILNWLDDHSRYLLGCTVPKIFVHSTSDEHGPRPDLEQVVEELAGPKQLIFVEAQDHFFKGALDELERVIQSLG